MVQEYHRMLESDLNRYRGINEGLEKVLLEDFKFRSMKIVSLKLPEI